MSPESQPRVDQMDAIRSFPTRMVALLLLAVLSPILIGCAVLVRLTSPGPVLYRSPRIGQNRSTFEMLKFRTMKADTPQFATHLLPDPTSHLTPVGGFLRKYSLDEVPQLLNIVRGEMQFIGPRPALFNQDDLMELRDKCGVSAQRPGITGWAQVNGRDLLSLEDKVKLEADYLNYRSTRFDARILLLTLAKLKSREITH